MAGFEIPSLSARQRPTCLWAAALVHALARDEAATRRPPRLTEPGLATWSRFRGRLAAIDLVRLLFEDAAVLHGIPFDPVELDGPLDLDLVPEALVESWLKAVPGLDLRAPGASYLESQTRLLELPARLARSDLHVVKPHQKVLELPGTGGQLAHHLVSNQAGLTLQDNCILACGSWQELTLAGIAALDLAAPHTHFITRAEADDLSNAAHPLRQQRFDFVVGLHPSKGGHFQVEDQLAIWFGGATFLLV